MVKKMKTFLVDDEAMALEVLENMLAFYDDIEIVGSYTRPMDALKGLENIEPDLIFLDIEMGEMNGLELAEIIMGELEDVEIVFVTAYSQYAVDAFEINAIDYLLKPIQERRLAKAIKRAEERRLERDSYNGSIETTSDLKVYSFGGFQVIDDNENIVSWRTQKTKELFAYLWIRKDRLSPKDLIIEAIFSDRELDKATTILHTTVYQLRKSLKNLGYSNAIIYSEEGYKLDMVIKSDLKDLKKILDKERYSEKDIAEILTIYKGDFLEEGYHWGIDLQESYRHLIFKKIEGFAKKAIKNESFSIVLKIALDKLYEIDPFSNSVVGMIIEFYGKQGEKANLEIFFKNYEKDLWEEMKLKATKEIVTLYNKYM